MTNWQHTVKRIALGAVDVYIKTIVLLLLVFSGLLSALFGFLFVISAVSAATPEAVPWHEWLAGSALSLASCLLCRYLWRYVSKPRELRGVWLAAERQRFENWVNGR